MFVPVTSHGTSNVILSLNTICSCHLTPVVGKLFFIPAQITFSIAIEGPLHLKRPEQNESDTGNMQLPYNIPGGYLVHVLFSQFVFFPINGPGWTSGKPRYVLRRTCSVLVGSKGDSLWMSVTSEQTSQDGAGLHLTLRTSAVNKMVEACGSFAVGMGIVTLSRMTFTLYFPLAMLHCLLY